jgi:hypothetical protein
MSNSNEYMKAYMSKRYHRLRAEYVDMLGGKCVDCGTVSQLEFDHVDRTTKSFDVGKCITHKRSKVVAELEKCVLRCKSCHAKKSGTEQSVDHGEGISGKKNCYCDRCAVLKREYQKRYR